MTKVLEDLYGDEIRRPSSLIELSKSELKRFEHNIIHLSGLKHNPNSKKDLSSLPLYSQINYGSNINKRKKSVSFVDTSFVNFINLKKTSKNYMMITGNKDEYLKMFKDVFVFDTCMSKILDNETSKKKYQSGVVLLMIAALPRKVNDVKAITSFTNNLYHDVKKSKPDINKSFDHFGTTGEVYAFGNKHNYKIVEQLSVGEYGTKTSKVSSKKVWIDKTSNIIDEHCAGVVRDGMDVLSTIIPPIKLLVSPIITAATKIQSTHDREVIKDVKTTSSGFWNTMLNVNGATAQFHCELDCTYTTITVPKQSFNFNRTIEHLPTFLFKMTSSHHAVLVLNPDVTIVYNGRFLAHLQHFVKQINEQEMFYNISCYGNHKLFNHLRKTFCRLNDNN